MERRVRPVVLDSSALVADVAASVIRERRRAYFGGRSGRGGVDFGGPVLVQSEVPAIGSGAYN